MKIQVIVVAGGVGKRLGAEIPKALVLVKGKPLVSYCLKVFEAHRSIDSVILVGEKSFLSDFKRLSLKFKKLSVIVPGGAQRVDSVSCGLKMVDEDTDIVLVHDAARPLVDAAMINRLLEALKKNKAAIVAMPVKATVKKINSKTMLVEETLRRDSLWEVQTPQAFYRSILLKAHMQKFKDHPTDDAMMVEQMGIKVKVVQGDYKNIKVTTPEDLITMKEYL